MTKSTWIICILSPLLSLLIWVGLIAQEEYLILPIPWGFWLGTVTLVSYCILLAGSFVKFFQANGWWWFNIVQGVFIVAFNLVLIGLSMATLRDLFRGWSNALF